MATQGAPHTRAAQIMLKTFKKMMTTIGTPSSQRRTLRMTSNSMSLLGK
jgi:hypothetical protein